MTHGVRVAVIDGPSADPDDPVAFFRSQGIDAVEHLKEHVAECLRGDYHGVECLISVMQHSELTAADLGIREAELTEIRQHGLVDRAKRIADEIRAGTLDHAARLGEWLHFELVTPEEATITLPELSGRSKEVAMTKAKAVIEACRNGKFIGLAKLLVFIRQGMFTCDEIGTDTGELATLAADAITVLPMEVAEVAAACNAGDFSDLDHLRYAITLGWLQPDQYDQADLDRWGQEHDLAIAT